MAETIERESHWIERRPLDEVAKMPAVRNPKRHDIPELIDSMRRFGFTSPPIIDERTGRMLTGHGRVAALAAMREQGGDPPMGVVDWQVPVIRGVETRDDDEAEAYVVADNQHTILGGWDNGELLTILQRHEQKIGPRLLGSGFDSAGVLALATKVSPPVKNLDTSSQLGDLLEYRVVILCTDEAHQAELLARFEAEGLDVSGLIV